ncbi:MAG: hypothetical protein EP298_08750 [Gammaproteobacteria bacterium]|nr:MAG: hypothetical protein EP298_08750 [Gammaproteobacteria bacterium]
MLVINISIKEVEYDDGYYQAEIINENGHKIDLKINPMTGKVNPPKNINTSFISMSKAISTAEKAGFKDFTSISLEHGIYKIKAHDKQSQETKIILNAKTGKVIYSELDN